MNPPDLTTNTRESIEIYDGNINQLKVRKNSLQQELNRLNYEGGNKIVSIDQEEEGKTLQDAGETTPSTDRLRKGESSLASMLKQQIDEIEREIDKNHNPSSMEGTINPTDGISLPQMRQKKIRLEQQLRNLDDKLTTPPGSVKINSHTYQELSEEQDNKSYQNQVKELRIKQEIRSLENEINELERMKIVQKTQVALTKIGKISTTTTSTENHLLDIEV